MENARVSQNFIVLRFDSGVGAQQECKKEMGSSSGNRGSSSRRLGNEKGDKGLGFSLFLSKRELLPAKRA